MIWVKSELWKLQMQINRKELNCSFKNFGKSMIWSDKNAEGFRWGCMNGGSNILKTGELPKNGKCAEMWFYWLGFRTFCHVQVTFRTCPQHFQLSSQDCKNILLASFSRINSLSSRFARFQILCWLLQRTNIHTSPSMIHFDILWAKKEQLHLY